MNSVHPRRNVGESTHREIVTPGSQARTHSLDTTPLVSRPSEQKRRNGTIT